MAVYWVALLALCCTCQEPDKWLVRWPSTHLAHTANLEILPESAANLALRGVRSFQMINNLGQSTEGELKVQYSQLMGWEAARLGIVPGEEVGLLTYRQLEVAVFFSAFSFFKWKSAAEGQPSCLESKMKTLSRGSTPVEFTLAKKYVPVPRESGQPFTLEVGTLVELAIYLDGYLKSFGHDCGDELAEQVRYRAVCYKKLFESVGYDLIVGFQATGGVAQLDEQFHQVAAITGDLHEVLEIDVTNAAELRRVVWEMESPRSKKYRKCLTTGEMMLVIIQYYLEDMNEKHMYLPFLDSARAQTPFGGSDPFRNRVKRLSIPILDLFGREGPRPPLQMHLIRARLEQWNHSKLFGPLSTERTKLVFWMDFACGDCPPLPAPLFSVCLDLDQYSAKPLLLAGMRFGSKAVSWPFDAESATTLAELFQARPILEVSIDQAAGYIMARQLVWYHLLCLANPLMFGPKGSTFEMRYEHVKELASKFYLLLGNVMKGVDPFHAVLGDMRPTQAAGWTDQIAIAVLNRFGVFLVAVPGPVGATEQSTPAISQPLQAQNFPTL